MFYPQFFSFYATDINHDMDFYVGSIQYRSQMFK